MWKEITAEPCTGGIFLLFFLKNLPLFFSATLSGLVPPPPPGARGAGGQFPCPTQEFRSFAGNWKLLIAIRSSDCARVHM